MDKNFFENISVDVNSPAFQSYTNELAKLEAAKTARKIDRKEYKQIKRSILDFFDSIL